MLQLNLQIKMIYKNNLKLFQNKIKKDVIALVNQKNKLKK